MNSAEKSMAVCAWCMEPASAVVVPAHCASSANGRAAPPRSRARSVCCCIRSWSGENLSSGETGVEGFIGVPASICFATNAWRCIWSRQNGLSAAPSIVSPPPLSRAQRAHTRLTWQERLARNARVSPSEQMTIRLFGGPEAFAVSLGFAVA